MKIKFNILKEDIIRENFIQTKNSNEPHQINNSNLDFAIEHINKNYLKTDFEKLSFLIISINNGHTFIEGSKRTSIATLIDILIKNKCVLVLSDKEIISLGVDISNNKYNVKTLSKYLQKNIFEVEKIHNLCLEASKVLKNIIEFGNIKEFKKLKNKLITLQKRLDVISLSIKRANKYKN